MKALLPVLLYAGLAMALQARPAPRPLPPVYTPDLAAWRLELTPEIGGWVTTGRQAFRLKLVDPRDPAPPKDEEDGFEEAESGGEPEDAPEPSAEELRQERLRSEEEARRNAWRERRLLVWYNGTTIALSVQVGHTLDYTLDSQSGENRLEILEPDSGQRVVRTWWSSAGRTRLMVSQVHTTEEDWNGGSLEVLEPGGELASRGKRTPSGGTLTWSNEYQHATPPLGTYTLRWTSGYRGGRPFRVVVEAVLDGGTDAERRWRFERLMLPGAGPATLGTIDIED